MIEIIVLIFLCRKIGRLAVSKGLQGGPWKLRLVLFWIAAEFVGVILAANIFGANDMISCMLVGIAFAVTPYFIIQNYLQRLPDIFNEDEFGKK